MAFDVYNIVIGYAEGTPAELSRNCTWIYFPAKAAFDLWHAGMDGDRCRVMLQGVSDEVALRCTRVSPRTLDGILAEGGSAFENALLRISTHNPPQYALVPASR